ncbi:MAG: TolB family protein [Clostridia bacterium]|nr:TolB family protein [Clostridia bacterium]
MTKRISILELLDIYTGETREAARFEENIEAPFFRGQTELLCNTGGRILRIRLSENKSWADYTPGESVVTDVLDTGFCTCCNNDHVLSPDGMALAVSHHGEEDRQSRIYIVDLTGQKTPRLVTPNAPSYLHGWSPDGKTLAYCACRNGEYDVYTIPADGGEEARLTDTVGLDDGPEYSPDGKYIWFNSVRAGNMDCWRMDADGGNPVRITDNGRHNWFPHISPDGGVIACISYDPREVEPGDHPPDKQVEIRRISPDGREDTAVIRFFGGQGSLNVNSFLDSRTLAFVRYEITE